MIKLFRITSFRDVKENKLKIYATYVNKDGKFTQNLLEVAMSKGNKKGIILLETFVDFLSMCIEQGEHTCYDFKINNILDVIEILRKNYKYTLLKIIEGELDIYHFDKLNNRVNDDYEQSVQETLKIKEWLEDENNNNVSIHEKNMCGSDRKKI